MANLSDRVAAALGGIALKDPEIDVQGIDGSIIATVVSGSFSGMDEAERQKMVWHALRESLSAHERSAVEFVFTVAPEEGESVEEAV